MKKVFGKKTMQLKTQANVSIYIDKKICVITINYN